MPRQHGVHEEHGIAFPDRIGHHPAVERVLARKVEVVRLPAVEHRRAERLGELDERVDRAAIAPDFFGDDERAARRGELAGERIECRGIRRRRRGQARRGQFRGCIFHQVLDRHGEEHRAARRLSASWQAR